MDKIASILTYVGLIGACLMSIGYILVIVVLIKGFDEHLALRQNLIFSAVTAAIGLVIMTFLKVQGQSWASCIEENKKVLEEYNSPKVKNKKLHGLTYFWVTTSIKDVLFKVCSVAATTVGVIYIVIAGSNDWKLLLLGLFNLLLFICFGMLACAKSYNYYNDVYIPYLRSKIYEAKTQDGVDVVEEECTKQRDDHMVSISKRDILEPCDSGVHTVLGITIEDRNGDSNDMVSIDSTPASDTSDPSYISDSLRA